MFLTMFLNFSDPHSFFVRTLMLWGCAALERTQLFHPGQFLMRPQKPVVVIYMFLLIVEDGAKLSAKTWSDSASVLTHSLGARAAHHVWNVSHWGRVTTGSFHPKCCFSRDYMKSTRSVEGLRIPRCLFLKMYVKKKREIFTSGHVAPTISINQMDRVRGAATLLTKPTPHLWRLAYWLGRCRSSTCKSLLPVCCSCLLNACLCIPWRPIGWFQTAWRHSLRCQTVFADWDTTDAMWTKCFLLPSSVCCAGVTADISSTHIPDEWTDSWSQGEHAEQTRVVTYAPAKCESEAGGCKNELWLVLNDKRVYLLRPELKSGITSSRYTS